MGLGMSMLRIVSLGGSCEPVMAMDKLLQLKMLDFEKIPGPFDWMEIPTEIMPQIFKSNWYDDVFDINNITTYRPYRPDTIGIRDNKYHIDSTNHFLKKPGINFFNTLVDELQAFKKKMVDRWWNVLKCLKENGETTCVFYREHYPKYFLSKEDKKQSIQKTHDLMREIAPKSKIIMVCDTRPDRIDEVDVIMKTPHNKEVFLEDEYWFDEWKTIGGNLNQLGKNIACSTNKKIYL
jgi:hypothetical protein